MIATPKVWERRRSPSKMRGGEMPERVGGAVWQRGPTPHSNIRIG
jgi:hypothetical protein